MDSTKKRGRKAGIGTLEARKYVIQGLMYERLAADKALSEEALARLIKAVKMGLGIK